MVAAYLQLKRLSTLAKKLLFEVRQVMEVISLMLHHSQSFALKLLS